MNKVASGVLSVVGIGPGDAALCTPQAVAALENAAWLYGYAPYLDRVSRQPHQTFVPSDNRVEAERAREALCKAAEGHHVAMVSGGDPGVFAMAAAVCEQIEQGPEAWRRLTLNIVPGVTAMLAVAAACGAPLGHDFCAISLSDNLKSWETVERRLDAAAQGGFVMAFYNACSRARPWQLNAAFERLRTHLSGDTVVVFGRAIGRAEASLRTSTLAEASADGVDMATLVIVGSEETRQVTRAGQPPLVYTPRYTR